MKPAKYNFEITQGDDFNLPLRWSTKVNGIDTPVNITGYHFEWEFLPQNSTVTKFIWKDVEASPVITIPASTATQYIKCGVVANSTGKKPSLMKVSSWLVINPRETKPAFIILQEK